MCFLVFSPLIAVFITHHILLPLHVSRSSPVPSSTAGPTCVPLYATKSSSAVTPSWAVSAAMPPISSTSSWRATLITQGASRLCEHTCRYVCQLVFKPFLMSSCCVNVALIGFVLPPDSPRWSLLSVSWLLMSSASGVPVSSSLSPSLTTVPTVTRISRWGENDDTAN